MSRIAEDLKQQLACLPAQDRAELAYFLLNSLDSEEDLDWEAAWTAELTKRAGEVKSGAVVLEPADKVFAELREKHS